MIDDRALWRHARNALPDPVEPDLMTLAAYAEGKATRAEVAAVETWLARHPERWADIAAARAATRAAAPARRPVARQPSGLAYGGITAVLTVVAALFAFQVGAETGFPFASEEAAAADSGAAPELITLADLDDLAL